MKLLLNFFASLVLLGAIQGLISAVILLRSKSESLSHKLFATLITLISLACLNIYLLETLPSDLPTLWSILRAIIPMIIIMPIGPIIYLYSQTLLKQKSELSRKDKWHFWPTVLDVIPEITVVCFLLAVMFGWADSRFHISTFIDGYNQYIDIPRWLSITFYLYKSYSVVKDAHILRANNHQEVKWVKELIAGFSIFQFLWLIFLVPYIIPATSDWLLDIAGWYPVYIPLMTLVYWLSIQSLFKKGLGKKVKGSNAIPADFPITEILEKLDDLMKNETLFLDSSLNLKKVVDVSGYSQKNISMVLNQHLGKSFNEYVNEFRVEKVKEKLIDPQYEHLTITGIAFECGFNSQATFQRAFKAVVKESPSVFRQKNTVK